MFDFKSILENSSFWQGQKKLFAFNEPLKERSSFKIGGNAEIFYTPENTGQLKTAVNFFLQKKIPLSVIGGCSNLLISDNGISGVVLSLEKFNKIEIEKISEDGVIFLRAEAGAFIKDLTEFAAVKGISGLEFLGGLPGSVGGACFMNARCYGKSVSGIITSAQTLKISSGQEPSAETAEYIFNEKDWDYKKSPFQNGDSGISVSSGGEIVISVIFKLKKGISDKIFIQTKAYLADRINKGHFKFPSAGSIFKNNHAFGAPSGKLIDEAGLCGLFYGNAQVAPWHGNFIINKGNASSQEVKELIDKIRSAVFEKYGFMLEPEVIFAGN